MLSKMLHDHFKKIAALYEKTNPGGDKLKPQGGRTPEEDALIKEIDSGLASLSKQINSLGRPRPVTVRSGGPKRFWAYVYYISFHDPINSSGPTEGFYPVFLMSVDQRQCWLTIAVAAASVGISGRGGWSKKRGAKLIARAKLLGRNLSEGDGWQKGPIGLGPAGSRLHLNKGTDHSAGRAYECCAIISKVFKPHEPPGDLKDWLIKAFKFYDDIFHDESTYIETSIPHLLKEEALEQENAAITGAVAENYFMEWVTEHKPEWGNPVRRTNKVGLGYDIEFPDEKLKIEVKGCRSKVDDIRMTELEWQKAEKLKDRYILAIVSNLDKKGNEKVDLINDPYNKLCSEARRKATLQLTYRIPKKSLKKCISENKN